MVAQSTDDFLKLNLLTRWNKNTDKNAWNKNNNELNFSTQ